MRLTKTKRSIMGFSLIAVMGLSLLSTGTGVLSTVKAAEPEEAETTFEETTAEETTAEESTAEDTATSSNADELDITEPEEEILVEDTLRVDANQVRIDATNFPDDNFRKYIKENFDKNNDDIVDNIENIKTIDVNRCQIYSLKGIEYFGAWYLKCHGNKLTSLDVSKNTALHSLNCSYNQLTSLDVSKNTALHSLNCSYNQLTSLDVSKNTALRNLYCYDNKLTSLDVSKNMALDTLAIDCNIITDISDLNVSFLAIFVPHLKGTIDLSNITGIEKYMSGSGWNGNTKKLTYELEISNDGRGANCVVGDHTILILGNVGWFSTYQGYDFYKDVYGNIRCTDSKGNPVINEFKCDGTYTYYFQLDGTAMINRLTYHPDGKHVIYFDENGHEVFSNFHHVEKSIAGEAVDDLCFFDVYGYMYVDVMTYDQAGEKLYYVNPYGVIERGKWFEFSDTCVWAGTTNKVGKGYGYANADGTLMINTYTYDWFGRYVYLQGNGHIQ